MEPGPPRSPYRLMIVAIFAVAWMAILYLYGPRRSSSLTPPDLDSMTRPVDADFRWKLTDLKGQPVDLASYRGRPILINLWATWCGPCLGEMPSIAGLAADRRMKAKDVVFLCISTDESREAPASFAAAQEKQWPMALLHTKGEDIPPAFQADAIPATFLISPEGKIVSVTVGAAKWDDPSVINFLERLAAH